MLILIPHYLAWKFPAHYWCPWPRLLCAAKFIVIIWDRDRPWGCCGHSRPCLDRFTNNIYNTSENVHRSPHRRRLVPGSTFIPFPHFQTTTYPPFGTKAWSSTIVAIGSFHTPHPHRPFYFPIGKNKLTVGSSHFQFFRLGIIQQGFCGDQPHKHHIHAKCHVSWVCRRSGTFDLLERRYRDRSRLRIRGEGDGGV